MQPIEVIDGVKRFKRNKAVDFLLIMATAGRAFDLNALWTMYHSGTISVDDMEQLYQLIGFSICGFCEVSEFRDESKRQAEEAAALLGPAGEELSGSTESDAPPAADLAYCKSKWEKREW